MPKYIETIIKTKYHDNSNDLVVTQDSDSESSERLRFVVSPGAESQGTGVTQEPCSDVEQTDQTEDDFDSISSYESSDEEIESFESIESDDINAYHGSPVFDFSSPYI